MNHRRLFMATIALLAGSAWWASGRADAHIDPEPRQAQPGSRISVGFTVEHGCEGSATVRLDMRLPDGATHPSPEPPAEWDGTVDRNVITFAGGPLPADEPLTFRVSMTLPPTPDVTIYFPFVQRCEVGEIRWISIPADGSTAELDEPAPAMDLRGEVVAADIIDVPATATSVGTTTVVSSTSAATPTTLSAASSGSAAPSSAAAVSTTTAQPATGAGTAGVMTLVGSLAAMGVIAALAVWQVRRQRR